MTTPIEGFSKLSKADKINWIAQQYTQHPKETIAILKQYWNDDEKLQKLHDELLFTIRNCSQFSHKQQALRHSNGH